MKRIIVTAVAAFVFVCLGQVQPPSTPAGKMLAEFLSAINSGEKAQLETFQKSHAPDRPQFVERTMGMIEQSGGLSLAAITLSEPQRITGTVKDRKNGAYLDFVFMVSASDPPAFNGMQLMPGAEPPSEEVTFNQLLVLLDQQAVKTHFQGTLLVAKDGKPVLRKAYGLADRENKKPNVMDTQLRMGSMNKMFTAVAALQLVDKGKLDLDAPVGKYLPQYPNKNVASKVKIRHLLSHQGGTGDIFTPEYDKARLEIRELKDYIRLFGDRDLAFEPGTKWAYSNYGFVLLGNIIEAVSGMSYYDYVRRNIFEPAGMKATDSLPESERVPNRAVGYMKGDQPNTDTLPWRASSAGGGYTTVDDLLRFGLALESGKILNKKLLDEATTSQTGKSNGPPYGFGFVISGEGRNAAYGHGGGAPGMNGELAIYRNNGIIFAALSNTDPPAATTLSKFFAARLAK